MDGMMMDFQLTLPALLRRAESYFGRAEIVTRLPDKSFHRYTYADMTRRARALAVGLEALGLERGDRVATLCWNHHQHVEAYLGVPSGGFVLHTLNLRLHPDDLAYIATHAGDRAVIVDRSLVPLLEQFRDRTPIEHVLVVEDSYEELLAGADPDAWRDPGLDENEAAAMCYTSGTTGLPKGVVYSHRSTMLHTLGVAVTAPLDFHLSQRDVILPVVPMFHANAWGYPYIATMLGAKQVYPGPVPRPREPPRRVRAGEGDRDRGRADDLARDPRDARRGARPLGPLGAEGDAGRRLGGAALDDRRLQAAPRADVVHGWGMTETSPVASESDLHPDLAEAGEEVRFDYVAKQGLPLPLVELRARDAEGNEIPWDGETMGELEVRGPWVASGYYDTPEQADRWTADGWFRTGDIVSLDPRGYIQIQDRTKDVIKSGGEWISSVALENALMGHPAVAESAVIGIPDPKWQERPLAVVVLREGKTATAEELNDFLAPHFAKWWLPERYEFVDAIPKTGVGKFRKTALREMFAGEPA